MPISMQVPAAKRDALTDLLDLSLFRLLDVNLETCLYVVLALAAVVACFYDLGTRTMSHDESLHAIFSWLLYIGEGYEHDPMTHGPFLFHINALFYAIFGVSDFTARMSTATFGVILVLLPLLLRKELGRVGALMVSLLTLISPSTLYYARYIRNDIYMMVWALLMAIALFRYLDSRKPLWLYVGALAVTMAICTKETAYITGFIGFTFLVLLAARQMLSPAALRKAYIGLGALLLALTLVLGGLLASAPPPAQEEGESLAGAAVEPLILAIGVLVAVLLSSVLIPRDERLKPALKEMMAYVVLLGTLFGFGVLPAGLIWWGTGRLLAEDAAAPWFQVARIVLTGLGLGAGGAAWWRLWARRRVWGGASQDRAAPAVVVDRRVLLITLLVAVVPFVLLYTTFFTNLKGLETGTVGAIAYWLAQQGVKRGSQPWYYYLIIAPLYDFVPIGLGLLAMGAYWITGRVSRPAAQGERSVPGGTHANSPFVAYCVYWALSAWLIYSWAGEKMPWMMVHVVQPMIVLAGRFVDDVVRGIRWRQVWRVAFVSLLGLGMLMTVHYTWLACYIHPGTPEEFLVYSHSTPDVKRVIAEIQSISRHLYGDEHQIVVAYSEDATWPFEWYLAREFPNRIYFGREPTRERTDAPVLLVGFKDIELTEPFLGQNYRRFNYKYLWFPHQDYYMNLSLAIPAPGKRDPAKNYFFLDMLDPEKRRAFLDVVIYRRYAQSLADWEPSNPGKFAFYVRKDIAAQMWDLSTAQSDDR
jgi:predicted membrane-bound mannosyltransferase